MRAVLVASALALAGPALAIATPAHARTPAGEAPATAHAARLPWLPAERHLDVVRANDADLAEVRRLEAALEYEPALVIVERVIARGHATREQLIERHLQAGKLAAGVDRVAVAEEHFARVLALAPATTLPDGTSPKLTQPFDAARARSVPLRVDASLELTFVSVEVSTDALRLVGGLAVRLADGREVRAPLRMLDLRVHEDIPAALRANLTLIVTDVHGNELWSTTTALDEAATSVVPATVGRREAASPDRHPLARPLVWGTLGVMSLTVAGLAAWRFTVAQDDFDRLRDGGMTDYTTLRAIERRGDRWALTTNLSLGAAGIAAVATVITVLVGRDPGPVRPVVARDVAGLALTGAF